MVSVTLSSPSPVLIYAPAYMPKGFLCSSKLLMYEEEPEPQAPPSPDVNTSHSDTDEGKTTVNHSARARTAHSQDRPHPAPRHTAHQLTGLIDIREALAGRVLRGLHYIESWLPAAGG